MSHKTKVKEAVIVAGRPFCGKNTHVEHLNEEYGIPLLDMGTALRKMREELKARHETQSAELMALNSARFVGDRMVIDITRRFILENSQSPMIILTGVPRNVEQVRAVLPLLKHTGFIRRTLWFGTSREVCLGRPMRPDRDDDTHEKRLIRMADFEKLTAPIRRLLEMKTDFESVDEYGGTISEVRAEIERLSFVKNLMIEAS